MRNMWTTTIYLKLVTCYNGKHFEFMCIGLVRFVQFLTDHIQ